MNHIFHIFRVCVCFRSFTTTTMYLATLTGSHTFTIGNCVDDDYVVVFIFRSALSQPCYSTLSMSGPVRWTKPLTTLTILRSSSIFFFSFISIRWPKINQLWAWLVLSLDCDMTHMWQNSKKIKHKRRQQWWKYIRWMTRDWRQSGFRVWKSFLKLS